MRNTQNNPRRLAVIQGLGRGYQRDITSRLLRTAGLAEREWPRFLSMAGLFFLIMVGLGVGRSAAESLFLGNAGSQYVPHMLVLNAVSMVVVSVAYSIVENRLSRFHLFGVIFAVFAVVLIALRVPLDPQHPSLPMAFAIFAFYEVYLMTVLMHFWTYANDIFDPRESRRIFPLIGGAGLVGLIAGSLSTERLLTWSGSTENLLIFWAVMLVIGLPLVWQTRRAARTVQIYMDSPPDRIGGGETSYRQSIQEIWHIPLIRTMTIISLPLWLVVHTVDWLFLSAVEDLYPGKAADGERTAFLGYVNGFVSMAGLFIQLFVARALLRVLGVAGTYAIYPITMALGAVALAIRSFFFSAGDALNIFHPRVWLTALVRLFDESVLHTVYETSTQLLYNAIPADRRGFSRAFITGAVEPVFTALAGGLLLIFAYMAIPHAYIASATAVVGLVWFLLALRVKKDYLRALMRHLSDRNINQQNQAIREAFAIGDDDTSRKEALQLLFESIRGEDRDTAILSLSFVEKSADAESLRRLTELCPELHGEIREQALLVLGRTGYSEALPELLRSLKDSDEAIRKAAIHSIGVLGLPEETRKFTRMIRGASPAIKREIIIAQLSNQGRRINRRSKAYQTLATMTRSRQPAARVNAARTIRELGNSDLLPLLIQMTRSRSSDVLHETIQAMGAMGPTPDSPSVNDVADRQKSSAKLAATNAFADPEALRADDDLVDRLVDFLDDPDYRFRASDALIRLGDAAAHRLHEHLMKPIGVEYQKHVGVNVRETILKCLGEIAAPASIPVIGDLLIRQPIRIEDAAITALSALRHNAREHRRESRRHADDNPAGAPEEIADEEPMPPLVLDQIRRSYGSILQKIERDLGHIRQLGQIKNFRATALLMDTLQRATTRRIELALHLLELLADPGTVRAAAASLRGNDRRARAEAIELLEGTGSEAAALATLLEIQSGDAEVFDDEDESREIEEIIIDLLITKQHAWFEACVAYCIGELRLYSFESFLREMARDPTPIIKNNAIVALEKLGMVRGKRTGGGRRKRTRKEVKQMAIDMERILFLRSVPLFADIDGNDLQWINEITREKKFKAGQTVFRENDVGDSLYIIINGSVRVLKGENQVILQILEERETFGEMSILDQEPRSATVEVQKDATLLAIKRDDFQRLLLARPQLAFSLFRTISRRLREAVTRFTAAN
ncbi:MAG: cyclic nucleotide-binding domain-containing protein [bacterium]|nr:cyclic nucleotide-binding domain-containing protein [bacterium]